MTTMEKSQPTPPVAAPRLNPPLRVLVIEDEEDIRNLVRLYLEGRGMQVRAARDGEEGWQTLVSEPIDIIVTDLLVPRLNGRQLVERVRAEGPRRDLPIIMISASFLDQQDEARCLQSLPVQAVFRKPLSMRDVVASVVEHGTRFRDRPADAPAAAPVARKAPMIPSVAPRAQTLGRFGPVAGEARLLALAQVANRCFQQRLDGVLEVVSGDQTRRVMFHDGLVVATSSSVEEERLSSLLREAGLVSEAVDLAAQTMMAREGKRYGYAVAQSAGIPPSTIVQALEEQTLWVSMQAFSRTSGTWALKSMSDNPVLAMQLRLDPMEAVQRAALDCVSEDTARELLQKLPVRTLRRSGVHEDRVLKFGALRPTSRLPSLLDDEPTMATALERASHAPGGANQLLALVLSGSFIVDEADRAAAGVKRPPVMGTFGGRWRPRELPPATIQLREAIAMEWLRTGGAKPHQVLGIAPDAPPEEGRAALRVLERRFGPPALDDVDLGPAKRVLAVVRLRIREVANLLQLASAA